MRPVPCHPRQPQERHRLLAAHSFARLHSAPAQRRCPHVHHHRRAQVVLRLFGIAVLGRRQQGLAPGVVLDLEIMRNVHVLQHLLRDAAEHRRAYLTALVQSFGRVENHRDGERRSVNRCKADERRNVLRLGIRAGLGIDLLRRARLAGNGVALEDGAPRRAEQHHAFHHLLHLHRGLGRDDAMLLRGMEHHRLGALHSAATPPPRCAAACRCRHWRWSKSSTRLAPALRQFPAPWRWRQSTPSTSDSPAWPARASLPAARCRLSRQSRRPGCNDRSVRRPASCRP